MICRRFGVSRSLSQSRTRFPFASRLHRGTWSVPFSLANILLALVLLCTSRSAVAQTVTTLHINEVESNGGVPDDWFELVNVGSSTIDISGWKMLDNDDTHSPYVFPSGTTIAPGAYLVVDTGASGFNFGLGAADSVRIFTPSGQLYESYSWTSHAATTYGRCPDGIGAFTTTSAPTKGTANACGSSVKLNEVESNGGVPDDWFELYNPGAAPADISGWKMLDNDDTHTPYVFPAGTVMAPGSFLVVDTGTTGFNFGLGASDSVRIFDAAGNLVDSYTWTQHATTTYGRCPDGTGAFTTTAESTKGTANSCGSAFNSAVKINEIESDGGVPDDWFELYNSGSTPADISGWKMLDNDDTHTPYVFPSGTVMPSGSFLVVDTGTNGFNFGLGSSDSVRLFNATGTLVDSYTWTAHAATTYGRCPDGTGSFTTTAASTKGTANACGSVSPMFAPWPGGGDINIVDGTSVFGGNLSGLAYESSAISGGPNVLWGIRNGPSTLYRLVFNGTIWTPDTANDWGSGKTITFPGGLGAPDSEGVTYAGSSSAGIYVSVERDNSNNSVSRNTVLRFDPSSPGSTLTATHDWNLTADLPATGANLGAEAITWVPDTFLTASGFFDNAKGHLYTPSDYPNHGNGLFFVGLEANGHIYVYALDHSGAGQFTRLAEITTGLTGVMDLSFDAPLGNLWAACDDTCQGRTIVLRIDSTGKFVPAGGFERPSGMPNYNNEGFTITPLSECASGLRPVFWADDSEDGGHAIRQGTVSCSQVVKFPDTLSPRAAPVLSPAPNAAGWNTGDVTVTWNWSDDPGGSGINTSSCVTTSTSSGEGEVPLTATCQDQSGNTGTASITVKVDKTNPTITATARKADGSPYTFGELSDEAVTVHYVCADVGSLIASCTADQMFNNDGTFVASGTAVDVSGRSVSSGALPVRINQASASPALSALITNKSGPANARMWNLSISNSASVPAANVLLSGFSLVQTAGAACSPIIASSLPTTAAPSLAAGGSATTTVTIDFSSCSVLARFTATASVSANNGSANGAMTLFNQLR